MRTLGRSLHVALVASAALFLTSCAGTASPEDAFLDAVHSDSRITQEASDQQWLDLGESTCQIKEFASAEDLSELGGVGGLPEDAGDQAAAVYEHAVEHLCP